MDFNIVYHAAIDLGASSGRLVLASLHSDKIVLEEVHRFDNTQVEIGGHHCWDLENIKSQILAGLKKCKDIGHIPSTIGIDTWGVDFVLLDDDDNILGNCVAYRDSRTDGMQELADSKIPFDRAYSITGIQRQPFNTLYQLLAVKNENPEHLNNAKTFLMVPDYLNYFLTGKKHNEYTNATTTGMINLDSGNWDDEIIDACGLPRDVFLHPTMPGCKVGMLREEIKQQIGYDTEVVLPATHDTGSAFLSVPAKDEESVYLSSGTWSLLGVESEIPFTTSSAQAQNFTNEGGYNRRFRFLRNIMGLWLIQSVRRELNGINYVEKDSEETCSSQLSQDELEFIQGLKKPNSQHYEFGELADLAREAGDYYAEIDVNDDRFLSPKSMITEIRKASAEAGYKPPSTVGEIMQCIYVNLAKCYKYAIEQLQDITGKQFSSLNIVGGGCQDKYLNTVTAKICGIDVYAGPIEATCIGNILVQMIYSSEIDNLQTAREYISKSFDVEKFN